MICDVTGCQLRLTVVQACKRAGAKSQGAGESWCGGGQPAVPARPAGHDSDSDDGGRQPQRSAAGMLLVSDRHGPRLGDLEELRPGETGVAESVGEVGKWGLVEAALSLLRMVVYCWLDASCGTGKEGMEGGDKMFGMEGPLSLFRTVPCCRWEGKQYEEDEGVAMSEDSRVYGSRNCCGLSFGYRMLGTF